MAGTTPIPLIALLGTPMALDMAFVEGAFLSTTARDMGLGAIRTAAATTMAVANTTDPGFTIIKRKNITNVNINIEL